MAGNYKKRRLEFRLVRLGLKDDGNIDESKIIEDIRLSGHRAKASISPYGHGVMPLYANVEIWGMNQADMFKFSYTQFGQQTIDKGIYRSAFRVFVYAGDENAVTAQVFSGQISSAYIDYSKAPDVSFVMNCASDGNLRMQPIAASTFPGENKVSEIIESLASTNGYTAINMGLEGVLRDQNLSGPLYEQLAKVIDAVGGAAEIRGSEIRYWSKDKPPTANDMPVLDISAETGMVGYPSFNQFGLSVQVVTNPNIRLGQLVKLTTIIPKASGTWQVFGYSHDLSDQIPDGPWFTTISMLGVPTISFDSGAIYGD